MRREEEAQRSADSVVDRIVEEARSRAVVELETRVAALTLRLEEVLRENRAMRESGSERLFEVRASRRESLDGREAYRVPTGPDGITHLVVVRGSGDDVSTSAMAADLQGQLGDSVVVVVAQPGTEVTVAELSPRG